MNKIYGYTVVAYPDSIPDDWEEKLNKLTFGYCWALHDRDWKVTDDGEIEPKKAHMHFYFQGKPTSKQKQYIHESLNVNYGEPVRSASGMFDYLTHENHPNKEHYERDSIKKSAKWDDEMFEMSYVPKIDYEAIILGLIAENDIYEYSHLINLIVQQGYDEVEKSGIMREAKKYWVMRYIDSRRNVRKEKDTSKHGGF